MLPRGFPPTSANESLGIPCCLYKYKNWRKRSGLHISSKCANRRMTIINIRLRRHHKTMKTVMADVKKTHSGPKQEIFKLLVMALIRVQGRLYIIWSCSDKKNYNCPQDYHRKSDADTDGHYANWWQRRFSDSDGGSDIPSNWTLDDHKDYWIEPTDLLTNRTQCPSRKQTRGCHEIPNWIARPTPGWGFSILHFSKNFFKKKQNIPKLQ